MVHRHRHEPTSSAHFLPGQGGQRGSCDGDGVGGGGVGGMRVGGGGLKRAEVLVGG